MSGDKQTNKVFKSGQAWAVFLVIFLAGLALAWSANKIMPILPVVQQQLNVSAQVAGWISSTFNVMGIILAFPAVGIIHKIGYRATGITALVCTLVGGIIGYVAPNEIILLCSRIIEGLGIGLVAVMAPALTSAWFPPEKRSAPMGIWSAWQAVTVACVFLFAGNILGPDVAWKNMYIIGIVIAAVALVAFIAVVRAPQPENDFGANEGEPGKTTDVFKNPSSWLITLLFLAFGVACMALVGWLSTFWEQTVGWDPMASNHIIGLMYAGEVVTCAVAGFIIARIKTMKARKIFCVICSAIYAACFFALYTVTNVGSIYFFCVLYVISEGVFCAAMWYYASVIPADPSLAPGTMAMVAIGQNIGMTLGVPVAGAILDATAMSGWGTLAILVTACMVIAVVCMGLVKVRQGSDVE